MIGRWPMAWASPIFALMTSVKGFFSPWERGKQNCENLGRTIQQTVTEAVKKNPSITFRVQTDIQDVSGHVTSSKWERNT